MLEIRVDSVNPKVQSQSGTSLAVGIATCMVVICDPEGLKITPEDGGEPEIVPFEFGVRVTARLTANGTPHLGMCGGFAGSNGQRVENALPLNAATRSAITGAVFADERIAALMVGAVALQQVLKSERDRRKKSA